MLVREEVEVLVEPEVRDEVPEVEVRELVEVEVLAVREVLAGVAALVRDDVEVAPRVVVVVVLPVVVRMVVRAEPSVFTRLSVEVERTTGAAGVDVVLV